MGLDVFLYKDSDLEGTKLKIRQCEDKEEELYKKGYDSMNKEERDEAEGLYTKFALSLGLDKYGGSISDCIEIDSSLYPDHLFKIGYFRSSYNRAGLNRVMDVMGMPTLYDIFNDNNEYMFSPSWRNALIEVNKALVLLDEYEKTDANMYTPVYISDNSVFGDKVHFKEEEALDVFLEEINKDHSFNSAYQSKNGYFDPRGVKVFGIMPGRDAFSTGVVIIIEKDDDDWYYHAYEIVKETIEYVLSKPNPEHYYLAWSG